jgi:O-antigen/teichoic acid export membrane protein
VPWIAAAGVVNGFYFIPSTVLMANKDVMRLPLYTLAAALFNVGLNLLLIPKMGMLAAAYATLAGYLLLAGLTWADARRKWPFPYEYRKMALAAAGALAFYFVASGFTVGVGWNGLVVRMGWALGGLGLLVLGTLGFDGAGRRLIRSV